MTPDERVEYLRAVWDAFCEKTGRRRDMTCAEYHVLAKMADLNRPLFILLRGIEETGGTPRTFHACIQPIERALTYHHQAVGSLRELPEARGLLDG